MALGGTIGPSGALIPANLIVNIKGEIGDSYDALDNIRFLSASGQLYTPDRVDTLFIQIGTDPAAPQPEPLGALLAGNANSANADSGALVTAVAAANQNGLPRNFGPGRGNWNGPTGQLRLRATTAETLNVTVPAAGVGSVVSNAGPAPFGNAAAVIRNFHGEALSTLLLTVECVHSVQG